MAQNEPWEEYRPSDGSPITISFDWHDDHSSWRLEDVAGSLTESRALLQRAGIEVDEANNVYALRPVVEALRGLYRNTNLTDAEVRRGLHLADDLDFGHDVESFDASDSYESIVEHVTELLDAWDARRGWMFTEDEWEVTASDAWEAAQRSRYGLGDRWSITITDDDVELPNGVTVKRLDPGPERSKLFDEISIDFAYVDDKSGVAQAISVIPVEHCDRIAQAVCDLAAGRNMEIDSTTIEKLAALVAIRNESELEAIIETATRLSDGWVGTETELLTASEALAGSPYTAPEMANCR